MFMVDKIFFKLDSPFKTTRYTPLWIYIFVFSVFVEIVNNSTSLSDIGSASAQLKPGTQLNERPGTVPKAKQKFDFGGRYILFWMKSITMQMFDMEVFFLLRTDTVPKFDLGGRDMPVI